MQVDVWITGLDSLPAEKYRPLLAQEEQSRADRFYFERDRHRFTIARGILRMLLAETLHRKPDTFEFSYAENGKPYLPLEEIRFNVSHSHGIAAFAIARDHAIGIDVELIQRKPLDEGIAERFFSASEVTALRSVPADLQPQAFFNCWTRKEAYIKAIGEGLSIGLDQFDVTLIPGESARLLRVAGKPQEAARWCMRDLQVPSGFAGALCAESNDCTITYHSL